MKFQFRKLLSSEHHGRRESRDPPDRGPSPSSSPAKKTLAFRGPSSRDDQAPRAASPPEPPPEPLAKGSPPRPVTVQARLWGRAYEGLKTQEKKVVGCYEEVISGKAAHGSQGNWRQLEDAVRSGLQKTRKESEVYGGIQTGMDAISSIKGILATAAHATNEGAAAWLVLSLGLEILSNPVTEQVINRKGIVYVMQRIDLYWDMVDSYFLDNPASPSSSGHREQLENAFVELYQKLLLYQMKSVIRYRRHTLSRWPRDFVKLDDWEGQLDDIHTAEASRAKKIWNAADLFETNPRNDKARIEDAKGGLRPEVFSWVLKNEGFQKWREDAEARLLWIKGDPGKGKTMLMCGIINKLNVDLYRDEARPLSFYFCEANDAARSSATSVLRGLICHLVDQNPALLSHVREEHRRWGGKPFRDKNAWEVMKRILISILNDDRLEETTLAVDALDECQTDLPRLLDLIADKAVLPRTKWVVSSRNWPQIERPLNRVARKCKLSLELNEDAIFKAVSSYIDLQVEELTDRQGYDDETRGAVQTYLDKNAHIPHSTFLWVSLVCRELSEAQVWEVDETLKKYPAGLDAAYQRMIEHIRRSASASLYIQILATMVTVYRPLTLEEIPVLIEHLEPFSDRADTLSQIIGSCGSFLTVKACRVYFVHQSAQDFLRCSTIIFPSGVEAIHNAIFSTSLSALLGGDDGTLGIGRKATWALRRDPYDLRKPGFPIEQIITPDPDPIAPVRYSCAYWVDHLENSHPRADSEDVAEGGLIERFLKRKFLYWVEALSLMRILPEGVLAVQKLDDITRNAGTPVLDLDWDAYRLFIYNREVIEMAPLQAYMSALIFSPLGSKTRANFAGELPQQYQPVSGVEESWGYCLQIIKTSGVNPKHHGDSIVSLTSGANMLATATWDGTIRIWNPETGICLQIMDLPNYEPGPGVSMVFSADGKRLATAYKIPVYGRRFLVWDVATGEGLLTLQARTDKVDDMAFLDDHSFAAIQKRFFTIWDPTTGECRKIVQLFEFEESFVFVESQAISRDGQAAVTLPKTLTRFDDGWYRIWLWDSKQGSRKLEGHGDRVSSMKFSSDGRRLVSGSPKSIKLWDLDSGVCLRTVDTNLGVPSIVALMQDDTLVWCSDKGLSLWGLVTGTRLEVPIPRLGNVKFLGDGRRFATSRPAPIRSAGQHSGDNTIEIFDASVFSPAAKLRYESLQSETLQLYSSPDGSVLVSRNYEPIASRVSRFIPWDPMTGACLDRIGTNAPIPALIVSAHHRLLELVEKENNDGSIRVELYKLTTAEHLLTLPGSWQKYSITSATISADGQKLILAFDSGRVELWDVAAGTRVQRLQCAGVPAYPVRITSVACSEDGQLLVTKETKRYEVDIVKVWNVDTASCVGTMEAASGNPPGRSPMALSADGQLLAVVLNHSGFEVSIWDVQRGARLLTVKGFVHNPTGVSFDPAGPLRLRTDLGAWNLPSEILAGEESSLSIHELEFHGYGVTPDCSWIVKGTERIIWIPYDYRAPVLVTGSRIVIGMGAHLVIFHLPADDLPE